MSGQFLTIVPPSSSFQDFFVAEGDGLPKGVVENAASSVQQILNLYSLDVRSPVLCSLSYASDLPELPLGILNHTNRLLFFPADQPGN